MIRVRFGLISFAFTRADIWFVHTSLPPQPLPLSPRKEVAEAAEARVNIPHLAIPAKYTRSGSHAPKYQADPVEQRTGEVQLLCDLSTGKGANHTVPGNSQMGQNLNRAVIHRKPKNAWPKARWKLLRLRISDTVCVKERSF